MPTATKASKKKKTSAVKKKKAVVKRPKILGRVVHFYDRIGVAIVEVASPFSVADVVKLRQGDHEAMQTVTSLQIEHQPVAKAKKGDVVGMKVDFKIPEGTMVMPG
jgi:hypothetical protein